MPQTKLTASDIWAITQDITLPPLLGARPTIDLGDDNGAFFIQIHFIAQDAETGELSEQRCRKWRVSKFSTRTEIVETIFKACWMAAYHEMKEQFRYKGQLIYSPHFDVDARVEMCKTARFDRREDP